MKTPPPAHSGYTFLSRLQFISRSPTPVNYSLGSLPHGMKRNSFEANSLATWTITICLSPFLNAWRRPTRKFIVRYHCIPLHLLLQFCVASCSFSSYYHRPFDIVRQIDFCRRTLPFDASIFLQWRRIIEAIGLYLLIRENNWINNCWINREKR